ncbi:MAG: LCP family protein [Tyzzerella sp.]|nr:LCP family protein [Tyzzerella sp.]MBQ4558879.1 LCP family protein [Tyzzerella sp.]
MKQGRSLKEAKAERAAKKRRAKRRRRALVLIAELFTLFLLLGIGYVMNKYDKFQLNLFGEEDILINEGVKQEHYTSIALFGSDSREGQLEVGTHADTIMIASIDEDIKEVRIVSIYRDLMTKQTNGKIKKANSAYFNSGPKDAINMLNRNFDLDIEDYVTVDFGAMADVVDMLGGIEIDVTEAEAEEMNRYIAETAEVVEKKSSHIKSGLQTLNGVETVTYSRIRKNVGGDYGRTERQRLVIQKLIEKVKETDISTINKIIDEVFSQVSTSFTLKEIIRLAAGVMQYDLGETSGFPFERTDGSIEGIGSVVIPLGVVENVEELHAFLYPKDKDYMVSDIVKEIAGEIEKLSGYTRADYKEE